MDFDVVLLSRIQFALTIMFHYIFPPLTIGMGVVMVYLEAMHLVRKEPVYEAAAKFWTQIFALNFAIGVASGIVMEFQFGTNWAAYSRFVGDVFGSALAAEGIFAFFLESGFLAVMVFGWDKVSPRFHLFATAMVALGSIFSAVWIIVANSWQQTPAGHHVVQMLRDGKPWVIDGQPVLRAEVADFWRVLFNPSTIDRLTHTLIGAFIMGSFFIMSISAYYLLKKKHLEFARRSFTGALLFAAVFSLGQLVSGHSNARMVAENQPAKLAAMESHFTTGAARLSLFGIPDEENATTMADVGIPGMLSFLIYGDSSKPVTGLDKIQRENWPPVLLTFASYHFMVALGMLFIGLTLLALWLQARKKLFEQRWLLWIFVLSVVPAAIANQAGWVTAEVGRQPWTVYPAIAKNGSGGFALDASGFVKHLEPGLRTSQSVSASISSDQVLGSIAMFGMIYLLLGTLWLYLLDKKIKHGPQPVGVPPKTTTMQSLLSAASKEKI